MMEKCLRCNTKMIEGLDVKVEGRTVGLGLHNKEFSRII